MIKPKVGDEIRVWINSRILDPVCVIEKMEEFPNDPWPIEIKYPDGSIGAISEHEIFALWPSKSLPNQSSRKPSTLRPLSILIIMSMVTMSGVGISLLMHGL